MKWKKYVGTNEKEAYLKVKEELGDDALIISVKSVKPKGISRIFKKPFVEVVATNDDRVLRPRHRDEKANFNRKPAFRSENISIASEKEKDDYLSRQTKANEKYEERVKAKYDEIRAINPEDMLRDFAKNFSEDLDKTVPEMKVVDEADKLPKTTKKQENDFISAIYDQLLENEVLEEHINMLTEGAHGLSDDDRKEIVAIVYKRIIEVLSDYEPIKKNKDNVIFFVGPTGVGKTTTIAKVASYFILNQGLKVALITADTYRIAAVEQLKTYANILNIPIRVIYNENEIEEAIASFKDYDLVFVDTAGRSHKNDQRQMELAKLLNSVDKKEVYLVLSAATKYKDLKNITKKYSDICDYKIIFTKLDETISYGNILNTKLLTGAKLSYVTFGQSVPEDISTIKPAEIAKNILGGAK